ncbi:MAG: sensor histidine kinase [Halobacteriales archaeon]
MSRWVSYELQRQQANEQLREQNEQLEQFASIVSHDLRSPLNVANGNLQLAQEECESDHLEKVAKAHDRMDVLIEDLLTLAREGDQVSAVEDVDLRTVAERCWQTVGTAEATLVIETELRLRADQNRIRQLLENLIRNAIEHGGEEVTLTIGDIADGFFVADDGSGIPEETRDEIFNVGYSTTDDGTGFGLSIVKQIAEAHGWSIEVMRSEDGGTRFEISGIEASE